MARNRRQKQYEHNSPGVSNHTSRDHSPAVQRNFGNGHPGTRNFKNTRNDYIRNDYTRNDYTRNDYIPTKRLPHPHGSNFSSDHFHRTRRYRSHSPAEAHKDHDNARKPYRRRSSTVSTFDYKDARIRKYDRVIREVFDEGSELEQRLKKVLENLAVLRPDPEEMDWENTSLTYYVPANIHQDNERRQTAKFQAQARR